jgi:predicted RNA-binding protein with PUA-like domain
MAKKSAPARGYWLFKTEPDVYSIDDLKRAGRGGTYWDGVRNYQARNYLRDLVKVGDGVLVYHSGGDLPHVAGLAEVVRAGYPDPTQFDPEHDHFDPKATREAPPWIVVDVRHAATFKKPVDRAALAADPATRGMDVLKRGNRLSIQPVTAAQFEAVLELGR